MTTPDRPSARRPLTTPDRAAVRKLAAFYFEQMKDAEQRGENLEQLSLDQDDEIYRFAAQLSAEKRELFIGMYRQEVEALVAHETAKRQARPGCGTAVLVAALIAAGAVL